MPNVRVQTVTPTLAQKWLDANTANYRKLREHRVVRLAQELVEGNWHLTGDAIVFDDDGRLLNGQHRLAAVVLAETPAEFVVLRGVHSGAENVMDTGLSRSVLDALRRQGEVNVNQLGAGLAFLFRMLWMDRAGQVYYSTPEDRPTTGELLTLLAENPDMRESVKLAHGVVRDLRVRASVAVACHYRFSLLSHDDCDDFMEKLRLGGNLADTDPIYHLRRLFFRDMRMSVASRRLTVEFQGAYMIKAWNFYRAGQPIQGLTWHPGGRGDKGREKFPIPK